MGLSRELIDEFVKVNRANSSSSSKETTMYGTIVEDSGVQYIRLDGSELLTPISTTTELKNGERALVLIKDHTATVIGNTTSPSARVETVKEVANDVLEIDKVLADEITTEKITAINAVIVELTSKVGKFENLSADELTALNAQIDNIKAKYAELDSMSAKDAKILNAEIDILTGKIASFDTVTTDEIKAATAELDNLKAINGSFKYVSAEHLESQYANIDFSNIGKAAMEYLYAESGLIKNVTIGDATITGELVGVTIKGNLIEGGTIVAEKLVIKGEDGLFYKLNTDGEKVETEQTEYNSLDGKNILANSITASKITVDDLVAFDATIGGFDITEDSLYSGVKESVDNTTRGVYMDKTGQFAVGDANNYFKYYKTADGSYRLDISAESVTLRIDNENKPLDEVVEELKDEITTLLHIESSRGTVFKNDSVSTMLSVVIYRGSQRITDATTLRSVMGSTAHIQWYWQKLNDESYGVISADDSRLGNEGFTFTLSPTDVNTKVTFMCELIV